MRHEGLCCLVAVLYRCEGQALDLTSPPRKALAAMAHEHHLSQPEATIFLVSLGTALVVEVVGVARPDKGDTITELWRYARDHLPGPARWAFRIFTGGLLTWAILHFLNDAP